MGRVKAEPVLRECSACGGFVYRLKRTWCGRCYQRWQNQGDPARVLRILHDDEARFWSKVDLSDGPDACHPWTSGITELGYGDFNANRRHLPAHVYAYTLANGPVPDGLVLDHLCHDPRVCNLGNNCPHRRCCNAAHLEAVTSQENILRGAKTKLSEDRVITLYGRWLKGELKQDLAADCGVDPHTISRRFKKLEAAMSRMDAHDVQRPGQNLAWS